MSGPRLPASPAVASLITSTWAPLSASTYAASAGVSAGFSGTT
nr:hypothetical protein [uncultured Modestobacter sp.]